jgi:hypothetical protein
LGAGGKVTSYSCIIMRTRLLAAISSIVADTISSMRQNRWRCPPIIAAVYVARTRHASSTARRNSLHRSHGLAKALRSGIRLVESFLTGLSFPAELPAIDCRPTADMASRPRSSARLPCADGAPPYAAASILVNDCGASLPPTEIITGALIDPILTRWGASERLPRAENRCAVRLQLMSGLVRIADSRQTSREVRKVPTQ